MLNFNAVNLISELFEKFDGVDNGFFKHFLVAFDSMPVFNFFIDFKF